MTIDSKTMLGKQDRLRASLIAVVLVASPLAFSQNASEFQLASSPSSNAGASRQSPIQVTGPVLREIDDPATGCRWILLGNTAHPEGPGRVLLVGGSMAVRQAGPLRSVHPTEMPVRDEPLQPVIHAGDIVVVEEHTAVVDARLAAVALGRAAPGDEFRARLRIGGKVVRARAIDSARGALIRGSEAQP
jgi:hypothetical protein